MKTTRQSKRELDLAAMPSDFAQWYRNHRVKVDTAVAAMRPLLTRPLPDVIGILRRTKAFGAEARRTRSAYQVLLNAALPAILHYTFNNLFRDPNYLPGIGNAASEIPYRDLQSGIPFSLPRQISVETAICAIAQLSRPLDNDRAQAAVLMAELATAFCVYHEVAHIVLGHIDALSEQHLSGQLLEIVPSNRAPHGRAAEIRRVWEYEADLLAANMLLQDMVSPGAEEAFAAIYGPDNDYTPLGRVQAMLGASLAVFLLISQATPTSRRTHPAPLVRFVAIANDCVAAMVEQHPQFGLTHEEMQEAVNDVAAMTLEQWTALQTPSRYRSPASRMLSARSQVEKLERLRSGLQASYRGHAYLYPFK